MDEYSRIYAKYVVGLKFDDLPVDVIEKTKMHFLDYLGNALAAYEMPCYQMRARDRLVRLAGLCTSYI